MDLNVFFERNSLGRARKIFAGFSGGADSTALLLLLAEEAERRKFRLKAVHFEHGLRGAEGESDAAWCRKFCEFRNIEYMEVSLDVNTARHHGESTETAARRLRLKEWELLAGDTSSLVALGHNANDRIENIFLRLLRGSNATGLTSLREVQKIRSVTVIRPILGFRRTEIEDFLKSKGISDWRMDSTNSESEFGRNYFRNEVIPTINRKFTNADAAVLKSVYALEQDADFLEKTAAGIFKNLKNTNSVELAFLKSMHPAIMVRFLRYWISEKTGSDFIPDSDFMSRFTSELDRSYENRRIDKSNSLIPVSGNRLFIEFRNGSASFHETPETPEQRPSTWRWKTEKELKWNCATLKSETVRLKGKSDFRRGEDTVYFDAGILPQELTVRRWRHGDTMVPFGKTTRVHLKKLFESSKIPASRKDGIPIVCTADGEIIWIPGLRRANFANIGPKTRDVAVFTGS